MNETPTTNPSQPGTDRLVPPARGRADNRKPTPQSRWFTLVLVAAVAVMAWLRLQPVPSAIDWGDDLSAGLVEAAAHGRPVLLSFSAKGCTYCRQMEAEVLPQAAVLAAVKRFIPVKVDAWDDRALSERYRVTALPTYVVVDAAGAPLARVSGFVPAEPFIQFLESVPPPRRSSAR